jgi:hypothetical protein
MFSFFLNYPNGELRALPLAAGLASRPKQPWRKHVSR